MKKPIFFFLIFLTITAFVFRSLFLNISENLIDWRDYSLVVWLVTQNIEKIISLNFVNFFDTNAFYPNKYTLFFADTFIPQSVLGLPFWAISKNPILTFNIVFFLTFILNYISSFFLWRFIFKRDYLAFIGSLLMVFSPFFHLEISHFQMLSFWPLIFSLYFLLKFDTSKKLKFLILSGVFLAIQFLSGVYFSVFLIFIICIFFVLRAIYTKNIFSNLKYLIVLLSVFLVIDGIFIKGYFDMKKTYSIRRDLKEFVTYSAHMSDYLFTTPINSIIHKSKYLNHWNSFDKNNMGTKAAFPGFTIFILALIGLVKLSKNKELFSINFSTDRQKVFFTSLILIGFIFSLGPRLNFNGEYVHIPTPYSVVLKTIPIAEVIRVCARWSFLFYLGLIFYALSALVNFNSTKVKKYLLFVVIPIFIALEYIPTNIVTHKGEYINAEYQTIKSICTNNKQVLLEIPVTHLDVVPGIVEGVEYIGKVELSSLYHECYLKNGYSGYDLPSVYNLRDDLYSALEKYDFDLFLKILKENQVNIIKVNQSRLIKEIKDPFIHFMNTIETRKDVKKINEGVYLII